MKNAIIWQIVLWLALAGFSLGFASSIFPLHLAVVATLLNLSVLSIAFYLNVFVVFPKYYKAQNNTKFIVVSVVLIIVLSILHSLIEFHSLSPHKYNHIPFDGIPWLLMIVRSFFLMLIINLISTNYLVQERLRKQVVETNQLTQEKLNTELKLLKAQINPHFIFNALNNIYSLSYAKSDKGPESILQLSNMLRYVIDDCSSDFVTLGSEMEYIENYISFQKMKSPESKNISFDYSNIDKGLRFAPLIFIAFIENSFKYSRIESDPKAYINIIISSNESGVLFNIENSIPVDKRARKGSGTGIENVKQRLDIIYKDKHELEIDEKEQKYSVSLKIKL